MNHSIVNSIAIAIVAIACLMSSFSIKSILNVIEAQNKVMMELAKESK